MKLRFANLCADFLGRAWCFLPTKLRNGVFTFLLILESRDAKVSEGLKNLFRVSDRLTWVINERAVFYGEGAHPKHYLTGYHDFFIDNIKDGQAVLDVGCGIGAVAFSVAKAKPSSKILGVDIDVGRLQIANSRNVTDNLKFMQCDATVDLPRTVNWEVLILSNVLEHIHNRVDFLKGIIAQSGVKKILIRVPNFQRDWSLAMRKELSVNYFSDPDHKIEHTIEEFNEEMFQSGLAVDNVKTLWGEIWAVCYVKKHAQ
jgi:SAM-dependent methyltransferase